MRSTGVVESSFINEAAQVLQALQPQQRADVSYKGRTFRHIG